LLRTVRDPGCAAHAFSQNRKHVAFVDEVSRLQDDVESTGRGELTHHCVGKIRSMMTCAMRRREPAGMVNHSVRAGAENACALDDVRPRIGRIDVHEHVVGPDGVHRFGLQWNRLSIRQDERYPPAEAVLTRTQRCFSNIQEKQPRGSLRDRLGPTSSPRTDLGRRRTEGDIRDHEPGDDGILPRPVASPFLAETRPVVAIPPEAVFLHRKAAGAIRPSI